MQVHLARRVLCPHPEPSRKNEKARLPLILRKRRADNFSNQPLKLIRKRGGKRGGRVRRSAFHGKERRSIR